MELKRDGVTVNAVIPIALTRMVATIPGLAEVVEAAERGEPVPAEMRADGLGTADDVAPLIVFLASDEAAGITGQAIGIGGDKLAVWSHPAEVGVEHREGGWTADEIAAGWHDRLSVHRQPVGEPRG